MMTVVNLVMVRLIVTMVSAHRGESSQQNQKSDVVLPEVIFVCFRGGACRARWLARARGRGLALHIV